MQKLEGPLATSTGSGLMPADSVGIPYDSEPLSEADRSGLRTGWFVSYLTDIRNETKALEGDCSAPLNLVPCHCPVRF